MKKTTYALIAAVGLMVLAAVVSPFLIFYAQKSNPNATVMTREEWDKMREEMQAKRHSASDTIYVSQNDEQADTVAIIGVPDTELPD